MEFAFHGRTYGLGASVHVECRLPRVDNRTGWALPDQIAFVQAVRWTHLKFGTFFVPVHYRRDRVVAGHRNRVLNGWMIDRPAARAWGHYGRRDDGAFEPACVTVGGKSRAAVLFDSPSLPRGDMEFAALTAAICLARESPLYQKYLGYYCWSFAVDANERNLGLAHGKASPLDRDAFDAAVEKWNQETENLSARPLPRPGKYSPELTGKET